ncbi:MAG: outer membrane beta-barrel protein [Tatlockia sp.]|nr:outer membrane beta-barrel protein [Tatlockia sp.]
MSSQLQAGAMGPVDCATPGKVYVGAFGGGGSSNKIRISQYGTAYSTEEDGGPLAVNAFGRTNSRDLWLGGGQLGFQWSDVALDYFNSHWALSPAMELEGYYLEKSTFRSHDINNDTLRLTEHDFIVSYPMSSGVFLGNAILNFNTSNLSRFKPFVGVGIGAAVVSISHADAKQISPLELGVNHYNSNTNDRVSAFAAQAKVGIKYDLCENIKLLAEYRGVYIANTSFTFGSTVFPGHSATSSWLVKFGSQYYNTGSVGIQLSV